MLRRRLLRTPWLWMPLAVACGNASEAPPSAPSAAEPPAVGKPSVEEIDRLRALGYLEFAEQASDPTRSGVVRNDVARVQPGYNLYNQQHEAGAVLLDTAGNVLHRFDDPKAKYWARVVLLADGDLVAVGADERGQKRTAITEADRFISRLAWDGTLRWKRHIGAHHDVEPTASGGFLTLAMESRRIPEMFPEVDTRDDWIVEFDAAGRELRRASLYELLSGGPFPFELGDVRSELEVREAERARPGRAVRPDRDFVDLLHTNSVERMDIAELEGSSPIHQRDSLLVTSRHQDTIAVVSAEAGELRWAWGRGEISGPHDATWLANGNLLLLDNGLGLERSRVLEIEPLLDAKPGEPAARIVWEYMDPEPERFYTASRGSAQRLANGNTLVSNSASGQVFEVTREGQIVWEFLNPAMKAGGKRATVGRMVRLDASFVEPILEERGVATAR